MNYALLVAGFVCLALANYDALVTTIALGSGSRPLTARMANGMRTLLRRVPRALPAGGPLVLLTSVAIWIGLLWAGYSLVFAADAGAVTKAIGGEPASGVSRVYYAGYVLFTLGNGGYVPATPTWEIVTVVATLNGLFVATLAITYLVSVVSAVVERRQLASFISALGPTAEEAVVGAWNGRDFSYLEQQLPQTARELLLLAQRHLAYPVLHDFRSSDLTSASERTLALLNDVVLLVADGVAPSVRIPSPVARTVRFGIDEALRLMPVSPGDAEPPPAPRLAPLRQAGIPVGEDSALLAAVRQDDERRRHLASLVDAAAWAWPNAAAQPSTDEQRDVSRRRSP